MHWSDGLKNANEILNCQHRNQSYNNANLQGLNMPKYTAKFGLTVVIKSDPLQTSVGTVRKKSANLTHLVSLALVVSLALMLSQQDSQCESC